MTESNCPIWGTPSNVSPGTDSLRVDSARAGGTYEVVGTAASMLEQVAAEDKAKLTTWLIEQRRLGNAVPIITSFVLKEAKDRRPLSISERCDGLLIYLGKKLKTLGSTIRTA